MNDTRAENAARAYFDAWNSHDVAAIIKTFDPAGTFWDVNMIDALPVAAVRGGFQYLLDTLPDLTFAVSRIAATEDVAVAEWRLTGTKAGADGQPQRRLDIKGNDVFEIRDGKVAAARAYMDMQTFNTQIG